METLVSAVLGDLLSRSVSFIIDRLFRQQKGVEDYLPWLRRVLLRIQTVVEQAEGHHITNQAILWQLQMLREAMYKGCYMLDTFTYRMLQQQDNDEGSGHAFAMSIFTPAKRFCSSTWGVNMGFRCDGVKEVQKMLGILNNIIDDMAESFVFLKSYPPVNRGPYSKHLFLENCMFGRQAEMDRIISFLLKPEPPETESLQVLPIIGPARVGKSTLVEHVCCDERVHNHFSSIILFSRDSTAAPEDCGLVKKKTHGSHGRSLIVIELANDLVLDERQRRKFYTSTSHVPPGSKVIVTSRSEDITKLGTTTAIKLEFLPPEAYWYFFKVMAFGSTNPEEHPRLASIAMELAAELDGSFIGANILAGFLRANMHFRFWRKILELERIQVERNIHVFGERPVNLLRTNQTAYVYSLANSSMKLKVLNCETHSPQNDVPKTMLHEVQTRSGKAHGVLEVLLWRSNIPPYHSYTMRCEMESPQDVMAKKKRPRSQLHI
ncbi:hypothetical protein BS78_03G259200 [Paspalum vaginatum]|nr:hypothetical protein BS78_03G259200 [Paspalum vaginatum]